MTDIKTNLILNELTEAQLNEQTSLPPNQLWLTPDDSDEETPVVGSFQKVLWTNNAPNASFASQTITFEAFNWDYILLLFMLSVGNQRCGSVIFSKNVYGSAIGYPNTNTSGADNSIRNFNVANSSITFEDCYRSIGAGAETVANNYCIPYQIIGIKTNTVPTEYVDLNKIEQVETVYDMSSLNSSVNWGLTSGIHFHEQTIANKSFSKYKKLRILCNWNIHGNNWFDKLVNFEVDLSINNADGKYCGFLSMTSSDATDVDADIKYDLLGVVAIPTNKEGLEIKGYRLNKAQNSRDVVDSESFLYFKIMKIEGVY